MKLLDVIKRSAITERSILVMDEEKYTFEVDTRAGRTLAKQTVESVLDVKVANISILDVHPEFKHVGKYVGYTKKHRKAIVTLTEDSKEIRLFKVAE